MKDRIVYSVSEQPTNQPTYRMPQAEVEKPLTHMQRIHSATSIVLAHRRDYLDRYLDIDIPHETSPLQKAARKFAVLLFGEELATQPIKEEQPASNFRQVIKKESQIGAEILGPIPAYDRREFYCFDERMWIWHEERMNTQTGKHDTVTVSYNMSDMGILKSYGENESRFVQGEELEHFTDAAEKYAEKVCAELYPTTDPS